MEDERRKAVIRGLEQELNMEEDLLSKADAKLKEAQTTFDVASRKYAAVRDTLTKYLGYSSYEKGHGEVGEPVFENNEVVDVKFYGGYRFIHMTIGNAVIAALREADEPLTLEDIVQRLRKGNIGKSESTLTRAVNAALMRTRGLQRNKDGKYFYPKKVEPWVEGEDLPF